MSAREIYKRVKKANAGDINLGHVFVDDINRDESQTAVETMNIRMDVFKHIDTYSNFYFPFDKVSLISQTKDDVTAVIFEDNPEHTLHSRIKFSYVDSILGDLTGYFHIEYTDKISDYDIILLNKRNPTEYVARCIPSFNEGTNEENPLCVIVHFQRITMRSGGRSVKLKFNELEKFNIKGDSLNILLSNPASMIMLGISYFFRLMVNTKLFVVEEANVIEKNGVIKVSKKSESLFRVIDIKTLRKEYIRRDTDHVVVGTRAPHERRRHTRTFRSDYYTHRKGETIIINPTWIGPTEQYNVDCTKLYKVRLDVG